MIIDTHVHIVAPDQQRYPRKLAPNNSDWVIDMPGEAMLELMRKAGIDRAILVQAHSAYEFDNSYVADVAIVYPERFVSVCIIDPTRADAVEELTYWVKERGGGGLRLFPAAEREPRWLDDPRTFSLWLRLSIFRSASACDFGNCRGCGRSSSAFRRSASRSTI
jgi:L-fuconolactonase